VKTIIAGSRQVTNYQSLLNALKDYKLPITEILSGHAKGADMLGERYAREHDILLTVHPADWDEYGKKAGYLRNVEMANNADALIALWDGTSKGTKHMIDIAKKKNLKVFIYRVLI
jgi:hypothetical protein